MTTDTTPPAMTETAKHTAELLPCPFCGGSPKLFNRHPHQAPPYQIICTNQLRGKQCQAQIPSCNSADEAVERWNTRTTQKRGDCAAQGRRPDIDRARAAIENARKHGDPEEEESTAVEEGMDEHEARKIEAKISERLGK